MQPTLASVVHCCSVDHIHYVDDDDQLDFCDSRRRLLTSEALSSSHVTSVYRQLYFRLMSTMNAVFATKGLLALALWLRFQKCKTNSLSPLSVSVILAIKLYATFNRFSRLKRCMHGCRRSQAFFVFFSWTLCSILCNMEKTYLSIPTKQENYNTSTNRECWRLLKAHF